MFDFCFFNYRFQFPICPCFNWFVLQSLVRFSFYNHIRFWFLQSQVRSWFFNHKLQFNRHLVSTILINEDFNASVFSVSPSSTILLNDSGLILVIVRSSTVVCSFSFGFGSSIVVCSFSFGFGSSILLDLLLRMYYYLSQFALETVALLFCFARVQNALCTKNDFNHEMMRLSILPSQCDSRADAELLAISNDSRSITSHYDSRAIPSQYDSSPDLG
ncbi:hypothetical protein L1987_57153 [Smallanthus sonchifolius]|uniref:Uncharacterized protein n=1 Tax=Smallanthus sonchifolius TaxID=185202 RepID=A0ACB9DC80_9ASTR|nr:hypothetical protein L1987_57153 [Smallanthus sonchifolius]